MNDEAENRDRGKHQTRPHRTHAPGSSTVCASRRRSVSNVAVLGMSHLGCVTAAGFSRRSHRVTGCDLDTKIIENLQRNQPPIYEPGLEDAIKDGQEQGRLSFTTDSAAALAGARFAYVALDTPVNQNDEVDIKSVEALVDAMAADLPRDTIVIISSQIPIGTSRRLLSKLRASNKPNELCYIPENLRLGNALECFLKPERTVFGISSPNIKQSLEELFAGVAGEKLFMSLESAEMVKHALNTYLATMISFSSEISDLCEQTCANALHVMDALRAEKRVSRYAPITPGLGFGGGTLARDVQTLLALGKQSAVPTRMMDAVMQLNTDRMQYVPNKLHSLLGDLNGKHVTFFGLTYKPETSTLQRSLALQVIDRLPTRVYIQAYDPMIRDPIASHPQVVVCQSPEAAVRETDALIIMTPWDEFRRVDYAGLARIMRKPIAIDTTNRYASLIIPAMRYYGIGVTHEK